MGPNISKIAAATTSSPTETIINNMNHANTREAVNIDKPSREYIIGIDHILI